MVQNSDAEMPTKPASVFTRRASGAVAQALRAANRRPARKNYEEGAEARR